MGAKTLILGANAVVLLAIAYQFILKDILFIGLGIGRTFNKIEDYPYLCRRLRSPLLESCEDMVIDDEGRKLYAACSTVASRKEWSPGGDKFNALGRGLVDHVSVLNLDEPGEDGFYGLHQLEIVGDYKPATGDKESKIIDVHGIDIEVLSNGRLRFWMINHRPAIDQAGIPLDTSGLGANSTIEVFEHTPGLSTLKHIKTIISEHVFTPNNLVATGDGGVLVTNDHDIKVPSPFRALERIVGGGNVAYCSLSTDSCHIASPSHQTFYFANGITKSPSSNLVYVASTARGTVSVFEYLRSDHTLALNETISLGMCIDNLSMDGKGVIFAAGFPKPFEFIRSLETPDKDVGSTVLRVKMSVLEDGKVRYEIDKALEDIEGKKLPGATVVVHDARTGSYWLGGVGSPYITICLEGNAGKSEL